MGYVVIFTAYEEVPTGSPSLGESYLEPVCIRQGQTKLLEQRDPNLLWLKYTRSLLLFCITVQRMRRSVG